MNQIELSKNRCTQCALSHIRCDRILPTCTRCIQYQKLCHYPNKRGYQRQDKNIQVNIHSFKLMNSKGRIHIHTYQKNNSQWMLSPKDISFKISSDDLFPSFFKGLIIQFFQNLCHLDIRSHMECLMLVQLTRSLAMIREAVKEETHLINQVDNIQIENSEDEVALISISMLQNPLLDIAYHRYFDYNHLAFPLFLVEGFRFESRSKEFQIALLACGMSWLPHTPTTTYWLEYFSKQLYHHLRHIARIAPTLDNMQIIIMLLTGLSSFTWSQKLQNSLLGFLEHTALKLGLHLTLPISIQTQLQVKNKRAMNSLKQPTLMEIERALTYNQILLLIAHMGLVSTQSQAIPFKHPIFGLYFQRWIAQVLNQLQANYTDKEKVGQEKDWFLDKTKKLKAFIASIICSDLASAMYYISLARTKFNGLPKTSFSTSLHEASLLLLKLKTSHQRQMLLINLILNHLLSNKHKTESKASNNLKELVQFLNGVKQYSTFVFNYLKFLFLAHLVGPNKLFGYDPDKLKFIVELGCVTINLGINLPRYYLIGLGICSIVHCMMFVVRYHSVNKLNLKLVNNAKEFLLKLDNTSLNTLVKINLGLFHMLIHLNQNMKTSN